MDGVEASYRVCVACAYVDMLSSLLCESVRVKFFVVGAGQCIFFFQIVES